MFRNGDCLDGINEFTCSCAPGYSGDLCEVDIDDCATDPCNRNGTCVDLINDYRQGLQAYPIVYSRRARKDFPLIVVSALTAIKDETAIFLRHRLTFKRQTKKRASKPMRVSFRDLIGTLNFEYS